MSSARVEYAPRPDATPEGEVDALAAVYSLVLQKGREKKNAAGVTSTDDNDTKGRSVHDFRAETILPE